MAAALPSVALSFSGIVEVLMSRLKARNALGHVFVSQVSRPLHHHLHTDTHTLRLKKMCPVCADEAGGVHAVQ